MQLPTKTQLVNFAKKYARLVGFIIFLLSFAFIIHLIVKLDIHEIFTNLPIVSGIIAIFIYGLNTYLLAFSWHKILELNHQAALSSQFPWLKIYIKSVMAKYIPGNFMQFAIRQIDLSFYQISQKTIAISSLIETISLYAAASIVTLFGIFINPQFMEQIIYTYLDLKIDLTVISIILLSLSLVVCAFLIKKRVFNFISLILHIIFFLVLEAIGLFILSEILAISLLELPIGILAFCWIAGFVIIGAPGGLGVRELAIILCFNSFYDEASLVVFATSFRIITLLGDVTFSCILIPAYIKRYIQGKF